MPLSLPATAVLHQQATSASELSPHPLVHPRHLPPSPAKAGSCSAHTPWIPQTPTVEQLRIAARARQAAANAADEDAAAQAAHEAVQQQRAGLRSAMHAKRASHEPGRVVRFKLRMLSRDQEAATADEEVDSASSCESDTASAGSSGLSGGVTYGFTALANERTGPL